MVVEQKEADLGDVLHCPILSCSCPTTHTPPKQTFQIPNHENNGAVIVIATSLFQMGSIQSHPDHKEEVISTSNIKNMSLPSFTVTYVSFFFFCHLSYAVYNVIISLYYLLHPSFQAKHHSPSLLCCTL